MHLSKKQLNELFNLWPSIKKLSKLEKMYPLDPKEEKDVVAFNKELKEISDEFNTYIQNLEEAVKDEEKENFNIE